MFNSQMKAVSATLEPYHARPFLMLGLYDLVKIIFARVISDTLLTGISIILLCNASAQHFLDENR